MRCMVFYQTFVIKMLGSIFGNKVIQFSLKLCWQNVAQNRKEKS